MGWRAWDAYDREAHERWKALPWRERYKLSNIAAIIVVAIVAAIMWYALR